MEYKISDFIDEYGVYVQIINLDKYISDDQMAVVVDYYDTWAGEPGVVVEIV